MVTASEAFVVYEALQIAKAGGIGYKAALDLMQRPARRISSNVGTPATNSPATR